METSDAPVGDHQPHDGSEKKSKKKEFKLVPGETKEETIERRRIAQLQRAAFRRQHRHEKSAAKQSRRANVPKAAKWTEERKKAEREKKAKNRVYKVEKKKMKLLSKAKKLEIQAASALQKAKNYRLEHERWMAEKERDAVEAADAVVGEVDALVAGIEAGDWDGDLEMIDDVEDTREVAVKNEELEYVPAITTNGNDDADAAAAAAIAAGSSSADTDSSGSSNKPSQKRKREDTSEAKGDPSPTPSVQLESEIKATEKRETKRAKRHSAEVKEEIVDVGMVTPVEDEGVVMQKSDKKKRKHKHKFADGDASAEAEAEADVDRIDGKKEEKKKKKKHKKADADEDDKADQSGPTPRNENLDSADQPVGSETPQKPEKTKKHKKSKSKDKPADDSKDTSTASAPVAGPAPTDPASINKAAHQWNVGKLAGGAERQHKMLKLLGGGKRKNNVQEADISDLAFVDVAGDPKNAERVQKDIEHQFEAGRAMRYDQGGAKRGLGA